MKRRGYTRELQTIIDAVRHYVNLWHGGLTAYGLMVINRPIPLAYVVGSLDTLDGGAVVFTVGNVQVGEVRINCYNRPVWYVLATLFIHNDSSVIDSITDVYECCKLSNEYWNVRWYAQDNEYQFATAVTDALKAV